MVKVSTLVIAGGTLFLAAGAGMFMQMEGQTEATPQVAALSAIPEISEAPVLPAVEAADLVEETPFELDEITLTSSDLPVSPAALADRAISTTDASLWEPLSPSVPMAPVLAALELEDRMTEEVVAPVTEPATPSAPAEVVSENDCFADLTGETRAAAMVALHLSAPCNADARVTFQHEGMVFTAMTDADGALDIEVPALSETATFLAMLEDGNGAAVEVEVDTLSFYDRSVVQWQGDAGVELHALEYGAAWDSEGHVWSGAPRESSVAARGEGGFLTRLGDASMADARVAEVYTFPTATAKMVGDIAVSIEIEVTAANCGQDLRADVIEVTDAMAGKPGELSLSVPGCDAVGDFIQLKNLVRDLTVASR